MVPASNFSPGIGREQEAGTLKMTTSHRDLQKLAKLRYRLLEVYNLSQEIGSRRPKRAPGERLDPETPEDQKPTHLDVLIADAIVEAEKQIWEAEQLAELAERRDDRS